MADVPATSPRPRIGLLDSLRGVALLAMASYHFTWDLEFFGYIDQGTAISSPWKLYARGIASTFLFLVGFSLVLAHGRAIRWRAFGRRFAEIAGAALLISVATYFTMGRGWIFFGILHAIALTSLVALPFLRLPSLVAIAGGVIAILLPLHGRSPLFDPPWFWWTGLSEAWPHSNDYVPLFPWLAPVLFGVAAGQMASRFGLLDRLARLPAGPAFLGLAGRHSLIVYLGHQPVLIALIYLASLIVPPPPPNTAGNYRRSCEQSCSADGTSGAFCTRFCSCTLDKLQSQNLLTPLQSGAIKPSEDDRILTLAQECTSASQ